MAAASTLSVLHFNDVYRVQQTSKAGTISADQFAAKIAAIRTGWGEASRALDFQHDHSNDGGAEAARDIPQHDLRGLTLFSGDVFNPSIESSVTRGEHMIDVLNALSIDCACLGNHDFDFGYPHLQKLMQQCNFPWTFTNIADVGHEDADLGHADAPQTDDAQVQGTLRSWTCDVQCGEEGSGETVRVGCIGLVERDWIATVPSFPPNFRYRSMVETARMLSRELRNPDGKHRCDLVIALTHCRLPNDIDLANDLGAVVDPDAKQHGVDLVLGGHDHTYYIGNGVHDYVGADWKTSLPGTEKDKSCMLVKSGTDFHDLSEISLQISAADDSPDIVRRRRIVAAKVKRHQTLPKDATLPELKAHIDKLMERVDQATGQPVAFALTPLDCRMGSVRTEESGVGNFIADILLHGYNDALRERDRRGELSDSRPDECREVDMALICGGSLRGDDVFGPGIVTLRDILTIMPFEDAVIVRQLKGKDILAALENGFGAYPSQEGRFPQVAGISVVWDSSKPLGSRVVEVRLLNDVHLFHADGTRKVPKGEDSGTASPVAEGAESYTFEREQDGGYSIEVNKPRIRKGARLEMERIYRVVTREYMADGHDGFHALNRPQGADLIDHENGSLMSTQVRRFLLGASLIWRLHAFRQNSDAGGKGMVGRDEGQGDMLSIKTLKAIERARALASKTGDANTDGLGNGSAMLTIPSNGGDGWRPSPLDVTSAGAESAALAFNPSSSTNPKTPQRAGRSSRRGGGGGGRRVIVDSSPGAFRDAMHVGISEHHSDFDAASQHFRSSRNPRREPRTAAAGGDQSMGDFSVGSISSNDSADTSAAAHNEQPSSAPARMSEQLTLRSLAALSTDPHSPPPPHSGQPMTASTTFSDHEDVLSSSSYFTPRTINKHVDVTAEDGAALREAEGSLAIIAPMRDGRLVDRARSANSKEAAVA